LAVWEVVRDFPDEDVSPTIAESLRRKRSDAVAAYEAGNIQLDDRSQLDHATREGRSSRRT
jgi:hypothetical protein